MVLSLNTVAYAVYLFANLGTFEPLGYYDRFAVYRWAPSKIAVICSLLALLSAVVIYHYANAPDNRKYRISTIVALTLLYAPLFITRVLQKSFNFVNIQRTPTTTDSIWLQYGAAEKLLHGLNPYIVDLKNYLVSHADPSAFTWIYKGGYGVQNIVGFVTRYDYLPPGFLYYLPAAAVHMNPNFWNIIMFTVFLVIFFIRIRPIYGPLYAAVLSAGMFIYFFEPVRYTPDTGWLVPLLILVTVPRHPRLSGILMAWAALYRPYVGIFLLFYLIALYHEGYDWKKTLKYAVYTGIVLTLPFFLWNPHAFIEGVLIPYVSNFSRFSLPFHRV